MTHKIVPELILGLALMVFGAATMPEPTTQDTAKPPVLGETQKLQLQNLALRLEIAQLRAQAAQRDFDVARAEFATLLKSLEVPGYTFDPQTLAYVKAETKKQEK